ncbi:hypothetical protein SK128_014872, partial [Halocaridina rubra]
LEDKAHVRTKSTPLGTVSSGIGGGGRDAVLSPLKGAKVSALTAAHRDTARRPIRTATTATTKRYTGMTIDYFHPLLHARHAWLLGSVYRGSAHRGSKVRGVSHAPGPSPASQPLSKGITHSSSIYSSESVQNHCGSSGGSSSSQMCGRKSTNISSNIVNVSTPLSTPTCSALSKVSYNINLSSTSFSKVACGPSVSSFSSSSSNENQTCRASVVTDEASENVDNGNIGERLLYDNNNHEQDEGTNISCSAQEDNHTQMGVQGPSSSSPSSSSSSSALASNSRLPVYRVVKGIKNSNQLFNYRFSPV